MGNKYINLKNRIAEIIGGLPYFYAFNEEQLKRGMEKYNVSIKDGLKRIGYGAFVPKDKVEVVNNGFDKCERLREEFLSDYDNLVEALQYELANHEYCITFDHEDAVKALGLTDLSEEQEKALEEAKEKYLSTVVY